jgi:hypothetical protein
LFRKYRRTKLSPSFLITVYYCVSAAIWIVRH